MKRWTCPQCGSTKHAPARPRRDDVRRYCLKCSDSTGRLVERVCGAADRARTERGAARQMRARVRRERERDWERAYWTVGRVDLRVILRAACRVYVRLGYSRLEIEPRVRIVRRTNDPACYRSPGRYGTAWYARHEIALNVYAHGRSDEAGVVETLLHELAHLAVGRVGRDGRRLRPHGHEFNVALTRAAGELWGLRIAPDYGGGGYGPSREIERRLRAVVAPLVAPVLEPESEPLELDERTMRELEQLHRLALAGDT